MTSLVLYDDITARGFEPFASTRPLGEMMAGARLIRERWEQALGVRCIGFVSRAELRDFEEDGAPGALGEGAAPGDIIVANSRFVPRLLNRPIAAARYVSAGEVVAARLAPGADLSALQSGSATITDLSLAGDERVEISGWRVDHVWDLIRLLPEVLGEDMPVLIEGRSAAVPPDVRVVGDGGLHVGDGATIEPFVVIDTSAGGVFIADGAVVHGFARIAGPCYIGERSTVLGGDISACAIGPRCKVRGEISASVMLGFSNKGHDGFVGHSYLGRWVNLGAGTVTSNLKNTYSEVEMWTPGGESKTGMQFLGTMFGDHVKTGIGLTLTTGTVLGTGANVFERMPPKTVAPFSWGAGAPYTTYRLDKFLEVTERVMARRDVALSDRLRRLLSAAHEGRWSSDGERRQ